MCVAYDKLLKPRQSFRITVYIKQLKNGIFTSQIMCVTFYQYKDRFCKLLFSKINNPFVF